MPRNKDKNDGRPARSWNFRRGMNDIREGINEDAKDFNRANMSWFARILGVAMLVAAILYLIISLRHFGLIK